MPPYSTVIGHVHLKVRDLSRAIDFYTRYFNLTITEQFGDQMVFLSGGDLHHEVALQARGPHAPAPRPDGVGLYHVAFEVPDKAAFAQAYALLREDGIPVGPVDHIISWAMYFNDPDGNGLEIYVDTRRDTDGAPAWQGSNRPLTDAMIRRHLP